MKEFKEWEQEAINFFTEIYNKDEDLQQEMTLIEYLKVQNDQGAFYTDLVECDENGNPIDYGE